MSRFPLCCESECECHALTEHHFCTGLSNTIFSRKCPFLTTTEEWDKKQAECIWRHIERKQTSILSVYYGMTDRAIANIKSYEDALRYVKKGRKKRNAE